MHLLDTLNSLRAKRHKRPQLIWLISGFVVFITGVIIYKFIVNKTVSTDVVRIEKTALRVIEPYKRVVGQVKLRKQTSLVSQVAGVVEEFKIFDGKNINKNEVMLTLKNPDLEHELVKVSNELSQLENEQKLTIAKRELMLFKKGSELSNTEMQLDFERLKYKGKKELAKEGVISSIDIQAVELEIRIIERKLADLKHELELDKALFQIEKNNLQSRIQTLQARQALSKAKVAQLSIYSPVDGRVLQVPDSISVGASIAENALVAELYELKDLDVRLKVSPATAKRFAKGMDAVVTIGEEELSAELSFIENKVENGVTFVWLKTKQDLANFSSDGENVSAQVLIPQSNQVMTIHKPSWYSGEGEYKVYCKEEGTLKPCLIELGLADDKYVEVLQSDHNALEYEVSQNGFWLGKGMLILD